MTDSLGLVDDVGERIPTPSRRRGAHETPIGLTAEWWTPPELFQRLALRFDLDVAAPRGGVPWVPADRYLTIDDNGLVAPWSGLVWCNPPFGALLPRFAARMVAHGCGVLLLPARTETRAFQASAPAADAVAFLRDRLAFVPAVGERNRAAGFATVLLAYGPVAADAVRRADLGWTIG